MEPIDICYTPLDMPFRPDVDMNKFLDWADKAYTKTALTEPARRAIGTIKEEYPWDLVYAAVHGQWLHSFDTEFPELMNYCYSSFSVSKYELSSIIFLRTRNTLRGTSFWHNDPDETGFRFYLENENYTINPLLLRKTVEPHNSMIPIVTPMGQDDKDSRYHDHIYTCNLIHPHQSFYINNYRAVHALNMNVPATRIAVVINIKPVFFDIVKKRNRNMIVNSALKFKDYAILW